jgi:GntR family transcriptional regulator/MocR family aminotransferase
MENPRTTSGASGSAEPAATAATPSGPERGIPIRGTGVDLHLERTGPRLRAGLTDALREAVRSGRLAPGTRMPASRTLAVDLGIARSTVTECYTELVAEGWLIAQQGSGTRVADLGRPGTVTVPPETRSTRATGALVPGATDFAAFPRLEWLAAARRALAAAPYSAFGYNDPLGSPELRGALAEYLGRVRGVRADPSRIVITGGFHHGLGLIARALAGRGATAVGVEAYGLGLYRNVLRDAGLALPPVALDAEGARTDLLPDLDVDAVLLTPAHQFPTGFALSPERRAAALDWARASGGLILEDDYDGEFRYDRRPVGALQGLDADRVVYFGTASKSIAPALRVAWMVVPEHLMTEVAAAKGAVEVVSVLDQLTLAEFIRSGAFDRHVRSRRQAYRKRREHLIDALADAAPNIRVTGMAAGLQAVLQLPDGTERLVVEDAAAHGLVVSAMGEFRHEGLHPDVSAHDALVVNFSAIPDSAWDRAVGTLCSVVANARVRSHHG